MRTIGFLLQKIPLLLLVVLSVLLPLGCRISRSLLDLDGFVIANLAAASAIRRSAPSQHRLFSF